MNVSKPLSSSDFETKHVLSLIVYYKVRESCSLTLRAPSNGHRTIPLYLTTCIQIFRFAKKACCPFRSSLSGKVKFFRHALTCICTKFTQIRFKGTQCATASCGSKITFRYSPIIWNWVKM